MSVVAAGGFRAVGTHCGIKPDGEYDLALLVADHPSAAAAVFTTSTTAAPSVEHGRETLADGRVHAVVVASGCANAGTGTAGRQAVDRVAGRTAEVLGVASGDVLVSTTGPIGPVLPGEIVGDAVEKVAQLIGNEQTHASSAARGILTTDTILKEAVVYGDGYTIGGMAKGAGMVRPDMATMLAFITTDADLGRPELQAALDDAVHATFNALNIDGCQSTNDTVLVVASGDSGARPSVTDFARDLRTLCADLAHQMAADAEGASRVVTLDVTGAEADREAVAIGRAIADSSLVRSSFYGGDPNWGRLLAAAGASGHAIDLAHFSVRYQGLTVAKDGVAHTYDEEQLLGLMDGDLSVAVCVGTGPGAATIVTTDLTPEYVIFNGERS